MRTSVLIAMVLASGCERPSAPEPGLWWCTESGKQCRRDQGICEVSGEKCIRQRRAFCHIPGGIVQCATTLDGCRQLVPNDSTPDPQGLRQCVGVE